VSRLLFVVPPLTGHVNPTVGVGAEAARRGHTVAWAGHPGVLRPLLPPGAEIVPVLDDALEARIRAARGRWLSLRGAAALQFLWAEFLIPLGTAMVPGVRAAVEADRPDLLVSDQQALAGPVAAARTGVPWVTSATTPAELGRPLAALPKVDAWVRRQLAEFAAAHGATGYAPGDDLRFSPLLTLVYSVPELVADPEAAPASCVYTGPALAGRAGPGTDDFPWEWLDAGRHRVLVSLGTLNGPAGEAFFRTVLAAVADLAGDVQVVLVAPGGAVTEPVPPHVLVREWVPQLALLPRLTAVVTHGGHNTVTEALAHGLPLVVAPIRDDQPIIAEQVSRAGAGLRVRFGRLRPADLRAALLAVCTEPGYRTAAQRLARSFAAAGGAAAAVDHMEKLL
jgi:MGT family glycosyltransferase